METPIWKVKFYGTRGSVPVCEPGFQEFGGNTTCIFLDLVDIEDEFIGIIDAGTGIRQLGKDIVSGKIPRPESIIIGFTHFHWDHIQGFPFFAPAYDPKQHITMLGLGLGKHVTDLKQIFAVQMQQEYFPVQLEEMGAQFEFKVLADFLKDRRLRVVDRIQSNRHQHPGGAFGFRFEARNKTVVICTDVEHGEHIDPKVVEFAQGADLLIHDAQYTSEELKQFRGWGHSSYEQAIQVAEMADVDKLILTHHDPEHDDAFLHKMEKSCQARFPNCQLAREGMEILV